MFNTVESLYEKIQLYFTKWFLLCLLQRDENEWFTSVSVNYTRIPLHETIHMELSGTVRCDSILISFSWSSRVRSSPRCSDTCSA